MESLVPALETCKLLKSAGFPQKSTLVWTERLGWSVTVYSAIRLDESYFAAPTAQGTADELPEVHDGKRWLITRDGDRYGAWFDNMEVYFADTIAEALAALWLKTQEAKR